MFFSSSFPVFSQSNSENQISEPYSVLTPTSIHIPSLNISATVESAGFNKEGNLATPSSGDVAVWYTNSSKPGAIGNAVIAGHVDDLRGPALFFELQHLLIGDKVIVEGKRNNSVTFEVISIESYPRNSAPISQIFGFSSKPQLNLITCHGVFDRKLGTHEKRLVVYTKLAEPQ